jgi:hypothetical protein
MTSRYDSISEYDFFVSYARSGPPLLRTKRENLEALQQETQNGAGD